MGEQLDKGRRGGMHIAPLCISSTLVLALLGLITFFILTAHNASNSIKEHLTVTLLLDDSVTLEQGRKMTRTLYHRPYTHIIDYIGKDETLKEQSKLIGIDPMEFLDENPFLASIELTLKANYANQDSLKKLEKEWYASKLVTEITYQKDLMAKVNTNVKKISAILLALTMIFLIISISLINNTIRLGFYSQRFKIHTMKLVGASYGFIRKPFMWKMFIVGAMSSLLACIMLICCILALIGFESEMEPLVNAQLIFTVCLIVIVSGLTIPLLCGYFSVNRFLKMKAGDLYRY